MTQGRSQQRNRRYRVADLASSDDSMTVEVLRAEDDVMEMAASDVLLDPAFTVPAVPEATGGVGGSGAVWRAFARALRTHGGVI
jgi:hypothetical protein